MERSRMRYRKVYTPTDYTTITPDMVRRWMAMEARLEASIKEAIETPAETLLEMHDQKLIVDMLQFIKDGKE